MIAALLLAACSSGDPAPVLGEDVFIDVTIDGFTFSNADQRPGEFRTTSKVVVSGSYDTRTMQVELVPVGITSDTVYDDDADNDEEYESVDLGWAPADAWQLTVADADGNVLVERLTVPVPRFFDVVSEPAQVHEDTELLALWTPAWEPHTTVDLVARSMSEDTRHTVSNVPDDGIEVLPENVSPTDLEVGSAYVLFYEVTKTKEPPAPMPGVSVRSTLHRWATIEALGN